MQVYKFGIFLIFLIFLVKCFFSPLFFDEIIKWWNSRSILSCIVLFCHIITISFRSDGRKVSLSCGYISTCLYEIWMPFKDRAPVSFLGTKIHASHECDALEKQAKPIAISTISIPPTPIDKRWSYIKQIFNSKNKRRRPFASIFCPCIPPFQPPATTYNTNKK